MSKTKDLELPELMPEIEVRLMGRVGEFAELSSRQERGASLKMRIPEEMKETTPQELISLVADQNPLLRDQLVRRDGTPRASTRILLDGKPPSDLGGRLELRRDAQSSRLVIVVIFDDGTVVVITDVVIIVFVPCDG